PAYLSVSHTKVIVRAGKVRIHLESLAKLLDRLVVPPRGVERLSNKRAYHQGKWISLLGSFCLCDGLLQSPRRFQVKAIPGVGCSIVRVQFNGPLEFSLRSGPVPVIGGLGICQRGVRLRQCVVDRKGLTGRLLRFGKGLPRRERFEGAIDSVAIGQSGPRQRV